MLPLKKLAATSAGRLWQFPRVTAEGVRRIEQDVDIYSCQPTIVDDFSGWRLAWECQGLAMWHFQDNTDPKSRSSG